ncbi:MAG: hypothetical protein ACI9D0_000715 [Bacteroidia bacterium]|jgi:hypothetical protein
MTRPLVLTLLALALSSGPALAGQVWVVDDNGGPGVDFTDVDQAVAAAADGDTLLIRAGSYSDLIVFDKSLSVIADTGPIPTIAGASVRNISAGKVVRLAGLKITSPTEVGLQIKNSAGHVWIEDCTVTGAGGFGDFIAPVPHPNGYDGITVSSSSAVSINGCSIFAGDGAHYIPQVGIHGDGANALYIFGSSRVSVSGTDIHGGNGGSVFDDDAAWDGAWGGDSISLQNDSELVLIGSSLFSGAGGFGGADFDIFGGSSCGIGGNAGDCIVGSGPGSQALLHSTGNSFTLGTPGPPYPGTSCSAGAPGQENLLPPTAIDMMSTDYFGLSVSSPVRAGQPVTLSGLGLPNAPLLLALSPSPAWSFLGSQVGLDLVDPLALKILPMGTTSASGTYAKVFPTPGSVPAGQSLTFYLQVVGVDPVLSRISLGAAASLSLLDSNL